MKDITTQCKECRYYMDIQGTKTCGKYKTFLDNNVIGCYGGEKNE